MRTIKRRRREGAFPPPDERRAGVPLWHEETIANLRTAWEREKEEWMDAEEVRQTLGLTEYTLLGAIAEGSLAAPEYRRGPWTGIARRVWRRAYVEALWEARG